MAPPNSHDHEPTSLSNAMYSTEAPSIATREARILSRLAAISSPPPLESESDLNPNKRTSSTKRMNQQTKDYWNRLQTEFGERYRCRSNHKQRNHTTNDDYGHGVHVLTEEDCRNDEVEEKTDNIGWKHHWYANGSRTNDNVVILNDSIGNHRDVVDLSTNRALRAAASPKLSFPFKKMSSKTKKIPKDNTTTNNFNIFHRNKNKIITINDDDMNQQQQQLTMASPELQDAPKTTIIGRTLSNLSAASNHEDDRQKNAKVIYQQFGPDATDVLEVEVINDAVPLPDQEDHVIVKVQASTVSLQDCFIRRGFDFDVVNPICLPITPGYDIVGHIVKGPTTTDSNSLKKSRKKHQNGKQTSTVVTTTQQHLLEQYGLAEGDRVAAIVRTGGNARYISVPVSSLVKIPPSIGSAEAVAVVSVYTTAYQVLKEIEVPDAPVFSLSGKKVLIIMGYNCPNNNTGNTSATCDKGIMDDVGQALIVMCLKARATVYATAPKNHHAYVQNVLHAIPLDSKDKNLWIEQVENEMDYVFDGVCEDGLETSYRALRKGIVSKNGFKTTTGAGPIGQIVCYGHSSMLQERSMGLLGAPMTAHVNKLWSQYTIPYTKFVDIWDVFQNDPEQYKKNLQSLLQLVKWNKIKPQIAKQISLQEVATEQERLESGECTTGGIIVCKPWKRFNDIRSKSVEQTHRKSLKSSKRRNKEETKIIAAMLE